MLEQPQKDIQHLPLITNYSKKARKDINIISVMSLGATYSIATQHNNLCLNFGAKGLWTTPLLLKVRTNSF